VLDLPGTLWRRADHDLLGAWLAPSFGQQVDASASRLVLGLVLTTAAGAAGLVWARRRQWAASHASAQATPPAAAASATAVR
jgi:hypothetical protein